MHMCLDVNNTHLCRLPARRVLAPCAAPLRRKLQPHIYASAAASSGNLDDRESLVKADVGAPASKALSDVGAKVRPAGCHLASITWLFQGFGCLKRHKLVCDRMGACEQVNTGTTPQPRGEVQAGSGGEAEGQNGGQPGGEIKSLQDLPAYPREFVVRRLVVFVGIVIGCATPINLTTSMQITFDECQAELLIVSMSSGMQDMASSSCHVVLACCSALLQTCHVCTDVSNPHLCKQPRCAGTRATT